jgi:NAD(P) transhydrogenase
VAIVGGGAVGIEFATVLATLGIPVTLVHPSHRLLPGMDAEVVERLVAELEELGVRYALGSGVASVQRTGARLILTLSNGSTLDADAVLFAAGRTANVEGLDLETAGVARTDRGLIAVDALYRTSADGIYAAGDVIGPALASVAMQQGRAAACHAFGLVLGTTIDRAPSSAVYGLPEIAGVGATEEQLRASGVRYVAGRADLATTARGVIAGRGGLLKLIVRADDRKLLGVHCVGDIASELVGIGHAVLHIGGPVDLFLTIALNTPTYSSAYRDAAIDVMRQRSARAGRWPSTPHTIGAER